GVGRRRAVAWYAPARGSTSRFRSGRGREERKMTTLNDLSRDLEELVQRTSRSVVAVEHHGSQGSGVVIADDVYVITNAHVAHVTKGEQQIRLSSGAELPGRLV